jgi:hypothetical protein
LAFVSAFNQGCHFPTKKILRNTEQVGTDGSSVGIPPVSQKRKTSEFSSEPFIEEKNPQNSAPNHFQMRKTSEFRLELFPNGKNLGIPF